MRGSAMRRAGGDDKLLKDVAALYPQVAGCDQVARVESVIGASSVPKEQLYNAWMLASFNSYADNDLASALLFAKKASATVEGDQGVVARFAVEWLSQKVGAKGAEASVAVYDDSKGFELFCDAGSNVPLYVQTSAALTDEIRACFSEGKPVSLLEVGVGAGRAFLPVAEALCRDSSVIGSAVLVEPSPMLDTCKTLLTEKCGEAVMAKMECFKGTLKAFSETDKAKDGMWDVAEATYALQSIPREERKRETLPWLYQHVSKALLIVEFDVPSEWAADPLAPASIVHVMQCYRDTLLTYTEEGGQRGIVARGFLIPVMYGYISRDSSKKTNEEIPIADWVDDLRESGFKDIHVRDLFNYEWSPARLIIAKK